MDKAELLDLIARINQFTNSSELTSWKAYREYEIYYANIALQKIGEPEDIPLLERSLHGFENYGAVCHSVYS